MTPVLAVLAPVLPGVQTEKKIQVQVCLNSLWQLKKLNWINELYLQNRISINLTTFD